MNKHLYRSLPALTALLFAALLALSAFTGCNSHKNEQQTYRDEDCFEQFMDRIAAGDYGEAYKLLTAESSSMPTPTPAVKTAGETAQPASTATPEPTAYILKDEFIAKYSDIFEALGVTSVTYEKKDETVNGTRRQITYTATYDTKLAGQLTNEYTMNLRLNGDSWRVAWTPALIFPQMTWGSTVRITRTSARRGDIIADGCIVALTVDLDAVYADKSSIEDIETFAQTVAAVLDIDAQKLAEKISSSKLNDVIIGEYKQDELTPDMRESIDDIEGAGIIKNYNTAREYPYGSLMAHTLGYVGYPTVDEAHGVNEIESLNNGRSELDGLYTSDSKVGKSGLEQVYERELRGKDGYNITIRDKDGALVELLYRKPVEDGLDVMLTIDVDLQKRTEEVLALVLYGDDTAGAVVVMDPTTGAVKALASYPTYDLNTLSQDYSKLVSQANSPLFNRLTQGLYPPGSAFKVFTATAAMETGTIRSDYVFTGRIVDDYWTPTGYGSWVWPAIKRAQVINRSTPLNMENALLHSDNIYFADIALKMGEEKFFKYLRGIGMEQKMPFELNAATSTIKKVGDNAAETEWNLRSIAETGYGQGQVTITPLQLATMYCAFRNGGDIPVPFVTQSLYATEGTDYHAVETFGENTWIQDAITDYSISVLTPMMEHVVSPDYNGTGRMLRAEGCTVAGKTGTAEKTDDKSREVSWIVCFRVNVPEEDELLVLVVLEIPTKDEYAYLKFDIARELISKRAEPAAAE